jgi:hypothetical protein
MKHCKTVSTALIAIIVLLGTSEVSAQAVFVARRALGRIERMTQPQTNGVPGYDVATVVIEGKADKVYSTALNAIAARRKLTVTRQDPKARTIDFSDGTHAIGLKISQVNDTIVHLLVVTAVTTEHDSTSSVVVSGVMRVCEEMGAHCSPVK